MTPSSKSVSDGVCEICTGTGRVRDLNKMCCHAFANCGCDSMPCPSCQPQQEPASVTLTKEEAKAGYYDSPWEKEFERLTGFKDMKNVGEIKSLKAFISQVSKDRYAEGLRRARERVAKLRCDCGGKDDCNFHDFLIEAFNAFDQLEEEVKK